MDSILFDQPYSNSGVIIEVILQKVCNLDLESTYALLNLLICQNNYILSMKDISGICIFQMQFQRYLSLKMDE